MATGNTSSRSKKKTQKRTTTKKDLQDEVAPVSVNLAVLRGVCSGAPDVRVLESGTRLAAFGVRVPAAEGSTSVPVTVWEPTSAVECLHEGDAVTVVGRVRRRFFRRPDAGPGTRVDVEAQRCVIGRNRRGATALRRVVDDVVADLDLDA